MIDTLSYTKSLEAVDVPRDQAEAYVRVVADIVDNGLATKDDLSRQGVELRQEIRELSKDLRNEMKQLEYRMTIKLGTIVTVAFGAFTAIVKFF